MIDLENNVYTSVEGLEDRSPSILILEDDPSISSKLKLVLQRIVGLDYICVTKDIDTCKYRLEHSVFTNPKLTFVNVGMLQRDNWEFLDWFENNGLQGTTKLVLFSNEASSSEIVKSKTYKNVIAFYHLPLTYEKMLRLLDRF